MLSLQSSTRMIWIWTDPGGVAGALAQDLAAAAGGHAEAVLRGRRLNRLAVGVQVQHDVDAAPAGRHGDLVGRAVLRLERQRRRPGGGLHRHITPQDRESLDRTNNITSTTRLHRLQCTGKPQLVTSMLQKEHVFPKLLDCAHADTLP